MTTTSKSPAGLFYGWRIVAAAFVIYLVSGGLYNTATVYFKALAEEFGWARGELSLVFALGMLIGGVAAPVWGRIADRKGPRAAFVPGVLITGVLCAALSSVSSLGWLYAIYIPFTVAAAGISLVPVSVVISNWFVLKRGRAMGIAYTGVGVGEFLITPAAGLLIAAVGWRQAYLISGLVVLATLTPLALWMKNRPQDMGLTPDGLPESAAETGGAPGVALAADRAIPADSALAAVPAIVADPPLAAVPALAADPAVAAATPLGGGASGYTLGEAAKTPVFWLVAITWPMALMPLSAIVLHQVPFMTDSGMSTQVASVVAGAAGGTSMFGRIGYGFLSERYPMHLIYASCYLLLALGIFALSVSVQFGVPALIVYACAFGVAVGGAFSLAGLLVADLFGTRALGEIFGLLGLAATIGGAAGATGAGVLFDRLQSYEAVFSICIALCLAATVLMLFVRRPQPAG